MQNKVTLGYWNIRGLAERIRLLLEYVQIPYDEKVFTPETRPEWFETLKPEYVKKNPAANLPYLLDGDKLITETGAIMVYLCHKANRTDLLG
jgi:glutathione S-transferase